MVERDIAGLVVMRVGGVEPTPDPTRPWMVVDGSGDRLEPVDVFLLELLAGGSSGASCRSYAYDLLRWFRFLSAVEVGWDRATRVELRDFVLWLRSSSNPARERHDAGAPEPGAVNARTGKVGLRAGYAPATINHAISVLSAFYDFHLQSGRGPLVSPVPPQSRTGGRVHAGHDPQEPFGWHRRGGYRQKQPDGEPRAVPDQVIDDLAGLRFDRVNTTVRIRNEQRKSRPPRQRRDRRTGRRTTLRHTRPRPPSESHVNLRHWIRPIGAAGSVTGTRFLREPCPRPR